MQAETLERLQERAAGLDGHERTELRPILSNVPWRDEFEVGQGVDVVTGNSMATGVKFSEVKKAERHDKKESIRFVSNSEEIKREIGVAVAGAYNTFSMNVGSHNGYLTSLQYNALSVTLLAKWEKKYQHFDRADGLELDSRAQELISDPEEFRRQYGDYFVAGAQRQATFIALYRCDSTSRSSLNKFVNSVKGGISGIFSSKGSSSFSEAAKKNHIKISTEVIGLGGRGEEKPVYGLSPKEILEALTEFKKHAVGRDSRALLRHYSTLDRSYPRDIDIAPEVFIELRRLYTDVWEIRSRYGACPKIYREQLQDRFESLSTGVDAQQSRLPTDGALRRRYETSARDLRQALRLVFSRMDLFYRVRDARGSEPKQDVWITSDYGPREWMYGFATYLPNPAVGIQMHRENWQHEWTEDVEHRFRFGGDQKKLIVGWKVKWHRDDEYNGYWRKEVGTILGSDKLRVAVKNSFDRSINYTVETYWVEAKDFQFSTDPASDR